MLAFILNKDLRVINLIDTEAPDSLPILDDLFKDSLTIPTWDFSVMSNHNDATSIQNGHFIVFFDEDEGEQHSFEISYIESDEDVKRVETEAVGIDLRARELPPYKAPAPLPIAHYIDLFAEGTGLVIRHNEIPDLARALDWEGDGTILERIYSVLNSFDKAECKIGIELNSDKTIGTFYIDILKRRGVDNTNVRLEYGENLDTITYTEDTRQLVTAFEPYGKEINEEGEEPYTIDITDLEHDDGDFYTEKGENVLYRRSANAIWGRFPLKDRTEKNTYRKTVFRYDVSEPETLLERSINVLREQSEPVVDAEITAFDDRLKVGDTVIAINRGHNPTLIIKARVLEKTNSFSDPTIKTMRFGNYHNLISANKSQSNKIEQIIFDNSNKIRDELTQTIVDNKGTSISWGINAPNNPKIDDIWYRHYKDSTKVDLMKWNGIKWEPQAGDVFGDKMKQDINLSLENAQNAIETADFAGEKVETVKQEMTGLSGEVSTISHNMNGLQSQVTGVENALNGKANQTTVTQLASLWQQTTDLANGHTSQISSLGDKINLKVSVGDVVSQINLEAGQTIIDTQKLVLSAKTVQFTGDAFIPGASIINLNADKIVARDLSVISANTGALTVDDWITIANDNKGIRGTFFYGDKVGGAFNPRFFEGSYMLARRYLQFLANVYTTDDDGSKKEYLYYAESFFGGDYFKMRGYDNASGKKLKSRVDITSNRIQITNDWREQSGILLEQTGESFFGGDAWFNAGLRLQGSLTTSRIHPRPDWGTFQINENRSDMGSLMLSRTGVWLNNDAANGYAELWVGKDSANKQLVRAPAVKSYTTSSAANVFASPTGILMSNSSSERFKINITTVDDPIKIADKLLSLDFKSWNDKYVSEEVANELTTGKKNDAFDLKLETHYGFIAEEVEAVGLGQFVTRDEKGRVDGLQYAMMWTPLIPKIKQLEQEINQLKNQINQEAS